jgi:hypothetical protein
MPDTNGQPLPPIEKESLDGYKESVEVRLNQKCDHKGVKIISATEIRCGCGAGWQGANILQLYKLLTT